jgi:hypothetical protein
LRRVDGRLLTISRRRSAALRELPVVCGAVEVHTVVYRYPCNDLDAGTWPLATGRVPLPG